MDPQYTLGEFIEELHIFAEGDSFSKSELRDLALVAIDCLGAWECFSCGVDTFQLGEDFYVTDELWQSYGVEGMLCIGCLETRLGRQLTPADFKSDGGGPGDSDPSFPHYRRSARFNDRVSRAAA